MSQVLAGIRVVEQGTFITGPCAGMMLADLGADVVKVESPTGDPYRSYQGGHFSPHFQAYNRNKRSIALDLKRADHVAILHRLAINIIRSHPDAISMRQKIKRAAWDDSYLLGVLSHMR